MPIAELGAGEVDKRAGAGRDRRLSAPALINAGSVFGLGDALASFRPHRLATRRTQSNFGGAAIDSWAEGRSYHLRSGVHSEAAACWELKILCQTWELAVQYDHLLSALS